MRVPATLAVLGVLAASAGVSAVALGQVSTWGAGSGAATGAGTEIGPSPSDAGADAIAAVSTAPTAPEDAGTKGEDAGDSDAAPLAAPDAGNAEDAGASESDGGSSGPSNVGFAIGLRGGYGIPFGNENGLPMRDYVMQGAVPISVDMGWFFTPHLYAGVSISYGIGLGAARLNATCGEPDIDCSAQMYRFGALAHYHFSPEATWDPWVGVGLGYEVVQLTASSQVDNSSPDSSPALQGLDLSLEAGLDFKPLRYVGIGPYVEVAGGPYVAGVSGFDIHGWAVIGARFRMNLF
jgi:hypothetical protein